MKRTFCGGLAALAAVVLTGCANFDGPMTATQQGPVGPVQVTDQFCSEGFGQVTFTGSSMAKRDAARRALLRSHHVTAHAAAAALPAGCANNQPGSAGSSSGQFLLGYQLPTGVSAPATITGSQVIDGAAGVPLKFTLDAAGNLAKALAAHYGTLEAHTWVGYISDVTTVPSSGGTTNYIDVTTSPAFDLPAQSGAPFTGPFDVVSAIGDRIVNTSVSGETSDRAIDCTEAQTAPAGSVTIRANITACFEDSHSGGVTPRDLFVQGGNYAAQRGTTAAVPFLMRFNGAADPSASFTLAGATNLPGAATSTTSPYAPATNSATIQTVNVAIPPGTPLGTYVVTMNATAGGVTRTGSTALTVTAEPPPPALQQPPTLTVVQPGGLTLNAGPTQTSTLPYSLTVSGRLLISGAPRATSQLPAGVTLARACTGALVAIQIKTGSKTVSNRLAPLTASCTYSKTIQFALRYRLGNKGHFRVRARFLGNGLLLGIKSPLVTIRYGG